MIISNDILIDKSKIILDFLGINQDNGYVERGEYITGNAPCHEGDNPRGFSFKYEWGIWSCWTRSCHEKYGSNIIGLISAIKKVDREEASIIAQDLLNKTKENNITTRPLKAINRYIDYWQHHLEQKTYSLYTFLLDSPENYCIERGLNSDIVNSYQIGIAKNGEMQDRLIVPIRNISDNIIGFSGRRILNNNSSKWMHWPGSKKDENGNAIKGFTKSINLFNIERATRQYGNTIILTEGPFDVIKLEMAGIHNSVALLGNNICRGQIELISKCGFTEVIMALDNDKAGQEGANKTIIKLKQNLFRLWTVNQDKYKDWGECPVDYIKERFNNKIKI